VQFSEMDENGIPILPENLGTDDMGKTQLIKQPDVIMMLYLLSDWFSQEMVKDNYIFYIKKTAHKSSLSPSIDALVACRAGDLFRAYHLFNVTLRADISNLYGNTHQGIHAASLGGTYQALIFGFAGLQIVKEGLAVDPRMPRTWDRLVFSFFWKGRVIKFEISTDQVKLKIRSRQKTPLEITIFGKKKIISGSKTYVFDREHKQRLGEFFY